MVMRWPSGVSKANTLFTILLFSAFIPYQVMLYPIVMILRDIGLYGDVWGLVIVHSISACRFYAVVPQLLQLASRGAGQGGAR